MRPYDDLTKAEKDRYMAYLMQRMSMELYSYLFMLFALGVSLLGILLITTITAWGIISGMIFLMISVLMITFGMHIKLQDDKALMIIFDMDRIGFFGIKQEDLNKIKRKTIWVKENGKANK